MTDGATFQSATPATPAAGTKVATDDCGTPGHVQLIKLAVSSDGSATLLPADATYGLAVDAKRLPKGSKTFSDPAPTTSASSIVSASASRIAVSIYNNGSQTVYLGKDNTVSSTNGMPLVAGGSMSDDVSSDAWWAVTASGTGDLRIIVVE